MWATSKRQEKVKANYWLDMERKKKKKKRSPCNLSFQSRLIYCSISAHLECKKYRLNLLQAKKISELRHLISFTADLGIA